MKASYQSQEFAAAKAQLRSAVADAFGWSLDGKEMNPPPALYATMREPLERPFHTVGEQRAPEPVPMRSNLQRLPARLFSARRPSGSENTYHLDAPDPSHIDLVTAIYDQYALCDHWDRAAERLYQQGKHGQREFPHQRQTHAIEAVRAQIAPYYAHLLMERGMSEAHAIKIIGNAIYCFTESVATDDRPVVVNPEKGTGMTPGMLVEKISNYAKVTQARAIQDQSNVRA